MSAPTILNRRGLETSEMIDRRALLASSIISFAGSAAAGATDIVNSLYRKVIVIDGNLVPPIDSSGLLAPEAVTAIRNSGLTVINADLDGMDSFKSVSDMIRDYQAAIYNNSTMLAQVYHAADISLCKKTGKLGIIFSFEKVGQLEGKIANISHFSALGVRVMQLSYNQASAFASGALTPADASSGLTNLGRAAVDMMNALGITIDLSHSDAKTTTDVLAASRAPSIISHTGSAAVYPHPRNKADDLLRAVANKGGVVGIYDLPFLAPSSRQPTVDDYIAHLRHALNICGEDHVGIGSDAMLAGFDTSAENMKRYREVVADRKVRGIGAPGEERPPFVLGMNTSRRAQVVAEALAAKRVPARVIEKVLGKNWLSVFEQSWTPT